MHNYGAASNWLMYWTVTWGRGKLDDYDNESWDLIGGFTLGVGFCVEI